MLAYQIRQLRGQVANQPEYEAKLELLTDKLPRERAVDRAGRSGGADRTENTETVCTGIAGGGCRCWGTGNGRWLGHVGMAV